MYVFNYKSSVVVGQIASIVVVYNYILCFLHIWQGRRWDLVLRQCVSHYPPNLLELSGVRFASQFAYESEVIKII